MSSYIKKNLFKGFKGLCLINGMACACENNCLEVGIGVVAYLDQNTGPVDAAQSAHPNRMYSTQDLERQAQINRLKLVSWPTFCSHHLHPQSTPSLVSFMV